MMLSESNAGMVWPGQADPATRARYVAEGIWRNTTVAESARNCALDHPDRVAIVDGALALTYGDLLRQSVRLANALVNSGLRTGDTVSFQLPNWHEAAVINLACGIGGFVANPIIPIYRRAEVDYILRKSDSRVLFVPESFRGTNYPEMVAPLREGLPGLAHVVVVRPAQARDDALKPFLAAGALADDFPAVDADAVKLLLYTSGTTGNAKGVLHSHNTLRAELDAAARFWGLTTQDVVIMPSPVTHITGYIYALELVFSLGIRLVMMDRWNAGEAVKLIQRQRATFCIGATPFLSELAAAAPAAQGLPSMRIFATGGAPVPPEVVRQASRSMPSCRVFRVYGSSEAPTVTLGVAQGDDPELGATTDGCVFNHEVKVVDSEGRSLACGAEGDILTRGPEMMLGYTDPDENVAAFDAHGYFRTGDLGILHSNGYLTITGRQKDLIIRGGEKIGAKEIEDVLYTHPAIREATVVAMPHPRMGETPCAYVIVHPGMSLDFDDMISFLEKADLARQKFPEGLYVVEDLPRTPSGKVLKHVLRSQLKAGAGKKREGIACPNSSI